MNLRPLNLQLEAECEALQKKLRETEAEHEQQRVMLRREARYQTQKASQAKHDLAAANTKVESLTRK